MEGSGKMMFEARYKIVGIEEVEYMNSVKYCVRLQPILKEELVKSDDDVAVKFAYNVTKAMMQISNIKPVFEMLTLYFDSLPAVTVGQEVRIKMVVEDEFG